MTEIRVMGARQESLPFIEAALGIRLGEDADRLATYTAFLLRRLVGIFGPCRRREVVSRAKQALHELDSVDLDALVGGALEDLIVGGDVLELPVLVGGHETEQSLCLLGAQPSFVVLDEIVRIIGIAPDDARFLPEDLFDRVVARGGDRFLVESDPLELAKLLAELGLRRVEVDQWLGTGDFEPPEQFLLRMMERLRRSGRRGAFIEAAWLWPSDGRPVSYRSRWRADAPGTGPVIVRAPQRYGNPRWYFAEVEGSGIRLLDLPVDGEVATRGCDLAWMIQLALDSTRGYPASYHVQDGQDDQWSQVRVDFPLPLSFRRQLQHLGGYRSNEDEGYRFYVPTTDLESAKAILAGAWMVPAEPRKTP